MNRYPWPCSALTRADMALLHEAREARKPRVPITELIASAVRIAYGSQIQPEEVGTAPFMTMRGRDEHKEAA